ncbi:MAG: SUF system Fe-S cluster assembly protein [Xanthomonadaceae bacterium]|nr:SUF system Fe-S cluster assembly protein [Xanthomonadaceae bacterium]
MDVKAVRFREPPTREAEPKPESLPPDAPLRDRIIAAMRTVYDPEIPVNIYDLGLIYAIDIDDQGQVEIAMTLTAPGCPVAGILPRQVEDAVRAVDGVHAARVTLVWDPPWDQDRISDEAKLSLGLF